MKIKQKHISLLIVFLVLIGSIISLGVSLSNGNIAYAWNCGPDGKGADGKQSNPENIPIGFSSDANSCFNKDFQDANTKLTKQLTAKQFEAIIHACNEAGGDTDRECADALVTCSRYALDTTKCTDPQEIFRIADTSQCNDGRLATFEGNVDACPPLGDMNIDTMRKWQQVADDAAGKCDESNDQLYGECQKAAEAAKRSCWDKVGLLYNGADYGSATHATDKPAATNVPIDFKQCLKEEMIKNAPADSKVFCESAGGIYVDRDFKDPVAGSNSNVSKGCKTNYSDLINEPACTAKGGKWTKINDSTNSNHWECKPPDNKNNDNTDKKNNNDDKADPVEGTINSVTGRCGQARVNLLACGEQGGTVAFNNVLRIILIVLSTIVGIAAVGGLAWAAILYSKAQDNQGNTQQAKELIREVVIGILLYGFLLAIIGWLVPGSVIGGSSGGWFG